jgi:hypothetical protein
MNPTILYIEKKVSAQLHEHILSHLPRMTDWYEWQGCELIYLSLHQYAAGNWNKTKRICGERFPLDSRSSVS